MSVTSAPVKAITTSNQPTVALPSRKVGIAEIDTGARISRLKYKDKQL